MALLRLHVVIVTTKSNYSRELRERFKGAGDSHALLLLSWKQLPQLKARFQTGKHRFPFSSQPHDLAHNDLTWLDLLRNEKGIKGEIPSETTTLGSVPITCLSHTQLRQLQELTTHVSNDIFQLKAKEE